MFTGIPPASGNLPSGKRGIFAGSREKPRAIPAQIAGGCLGVPDTMITLGLARLSAHPPDLIVMTG
jgi:hypothetical protein